MKHLSAICVGFLFFSITVCIYSFSLHPPESKVSFLDIGQGDAILIDAGNGNQMLVDSGRNEKILEELGEKMEYGDKTIEVIMATHFDLDHIGGFEDVLENFHIETLLVNGSDPSSKTSQRFLEDIKEKEIKTQVVSAGSIINMGNGVFAKILFPFWTSDVQNGNEGSISMKLFTPKGTIMLTGDASSKIEYKLVSKYGESLKSDVLKLGHHGSKTSTSRAFLEMVDPEIVVVSAGEDNQYGHPHSSVMDRVIDLNIPTYYTFKEDVEF